MRNLTLSFLFSFSLLATPSWADEGPCSDDAYRAFDFWLGKWQVTTPDGQHAGVNEITRAEQGCLLIEQWRGAQGNGGQSYNFYDAASQQWRQVWVSPGIIIDYTGGLVDGAMKLEGEIAYQDMGKSVAFRGTWTPQDDGAVTQHLEQFDPQMQKWQSWFKGIYRRVED